MRGFCSTEVRFLTLISLTLESFCHNSGRFLHIRPPNVVKKVIMLINRNLRYPILSCLISKITIDFWNVIVNFLDDLYIVHLRLSQYTHEIIFATLKHAIVIWQRLFTHLLTNENFRSYIFWVTEFFHKKFKCLCYFINQNLKC